MTNRNELALDAFLSDGGRLDQLLQRGTPKYFIKSTDAKPTDAVLGSELYYVDTGDYFVYYDDGWHLKVQGDYSAIKFTLTAKRGALASAVNHDTVTVTYDSEYGTLPTTTPTDGYKLEGWYFNTELTDKVSATDIVKIEDDANIYAKHVPIDYPITYNLNDGVNNPANPESYTVLAAVAFEDATKEGYTFDGWYEEDTFTTKVTEIALGSTGDVVLYAQFTAIEYDITYDLDGGANGANPATYNIEDTPVALADATKGGFTFEGWFSDAGKTIAVTEIALGQIGEVALYAKFTEIAP